MKLNITKLRKKLAFLLDESFFRFYEYQDGCEYRVLDDSTLLLWGEDDILALNPYYDDIEICESIFFFGSDGGDEGYAFDSKSMLIVSINWLDIGYETPKPICSTFEDFFTKKGIAFPIR